MKKILVLLAVIPLLAANCSKKAVPQKSPPVVVQPQIDTTYSFLTKSDVDTFKQAGLELAAVQLYLSNPVSIKRVKQTYDAVSTDEEGQVHYLFNSPRAVHFIELCPAVCVSTDSGKVKVTAEGDVDSLTMPFTVVGNRYQLVEKFMYDGYPYEVAKDSGYQAVFLKYRPIYDEGEVREAPGTTVGEMGQSETVNEKKDIQPKGKTGPSPVRNPKNPANPPKRSQSKTTTSSPSQDTGPR